MWLASIDIGIKNFAFAVIDWKGRKSILGNQGGTEFDIVDLQNIDITTSNKIEKDIARNIIDVLDAYKSIWDQCDYFIIEQQMQFRHATNIKALKISQYVLCYFCIHYKDKTIVEYPAYHKTQVLGAPPGLKKHERKKWAVNKVRSILTEQSQEHLLDDFKKKADDISDCICLSLAYITQHNL
jgi:DNA mismatch repair ATPase MutS